MNYLDTAKKAVVPGILISIGVCGLLVTSYSIVSMFLFAFGLLSICVLKLNLFTGKCGYVFENKDFLGLFIILIVNLIVAYIAGMAYSCMFPAVKDVALEKIATWDWSLSYFLKSVFCGIIMFMAVDTYKKGTIFGILLGIPLFILCGFQHCIANVVTMGYLMTFNSALILCIIGNMCGSLLIWVFVKEGKKEKQ